MTTNCPELKDIRAAAIRLHLIGSTPSPVLNDKISDIHEHVFAIKRKVYLWRLNRFD